MTLMEQVADEPAHETICNAGADQSRVRQVGDAIRNASQTIDGAYLTAVRDRRGDARSRAVPAGI